MAASNSQGRNNGINHSNAANNEESLQDDVNCKYCSLGDNTLMIQCDKCDDWSHNECAKSAIVEVGPWICNECFLELQENVNNTPAVSNVVVELSKKICTSCCQLIDENSLTCVSCGNSFHVTCVNEEAATLLWNCSVCRDVMPKHFTIGSRKGARSNTSSKAGNVHLALQRLDEERQLARKMIQVEQDFIREKRGRANLLIEIEQQYLNEKYNLLEHAQSSSSVSSAESEPSASVSNRKIGHWLNSSIRSLNQLALHSNKETQPSVTQEPATTSIPAHIGGRYNACGTIRKPTHHRYLEPGKEVSSKHKPRFISSLTKPIIDESTRQKLPNINKNPRRRTPTSSLNFNTNALSRMTVIPEPVTSTSEDEHDDHRHAQAPTNLQRCRQSARRREYPNLTPAQVSARQALSIKCDLPVFSGDPLEFPIFISNYRLSTARCGYTNDENLIRLQRCLKGNAAKDVRSMLLLPDTVPQAIDCLSLKYGRPEIILNTLLREIQAASNVKMEKLQSLIDLSLLIQNLVATATASGLRAHLTNPMLIQELLMKLPANLQLAWASHRKLFMEVDLSTFAHWLNELATDVASISIPTVELEKPGTKNRPPKNQHVQGSHIPKDKSLTTSEDSSCDNCGESHHVRKCPKFAELNKNERWTLVNEKKLCRSCLGRHFTLRCRNRKPCEIDGCTAKHHQLLHNSKENDKAVVKPPSKEASDQNTSTCMAQHKNHNSSIFRIVPVKLYGKNKQIEAYAYLDDGSGVTLMEEKLANELDLHGARSTLCLKWSGGVTREEANSRTVTLQISCSNGSEKYVLRQVKTVASLDLTLQTLNMQQLIEKYKHLTGVPAESYENAAPQILIGLNNWNIATPLETIEGRWGEPIANRTRLGWVICGSYLSNSTNDVLNMNVHQCDCKSDENLHEMVREHFTIENFGVRHPQSTLESKEDTRARSLLESTTRWNGQRFETGLLWKNDHIKLPNNRVMAEKRLSCLTRKMRQNEQLSKNLREKMMQYEQRGYARKLSKSEIDQHHERTWYLPVFVVQQPNKPSKLRLVWDAASKFKGTSLNDNLLKGPDQVTPLLTILSQFREYTIAISGDIAEMFHQVLVTPSDQHSQRFLFPNEDLNSHDPETYVMRVLTFGSTCSPASAQHVKNINADRFRIESPVAANAIKNKHYVDDYLHSFNDLDEAIQTVKEVRRIHALGGFTIRNWLSNSSEVLSALNEKKTTENKNLTNMETLVEKVLGMRWNTVRDSFVFVLNIKRIGEEIWGGLRRPTKREILRTLMMLFDPLGLLSFMMVPLKLLLHEIWRQPLDWDDPITNELHEKWLNWTKLMMHLDEIEIPRHYGTLAIHDNIQIHVLVDASETAYAAVAYIRFGSKHIESKCSLIGSKCRTAPQKPVSVPRMELMAAVLGARFINYIQETHTIKASKLFLWTDSRTVLRWMRSDARRYKPFVAIRIGELLEITNAKDWRWIPSTLNIADEATKIKDHKNFATLSNAWFDGPEFLCKPETEWPHDDEYRETTEEDVIELKVQGAHYEINLLRPVTPNPIRFSRWKKLLYVQGWLERAIHNFKCPKQDRRCGPLNNDELKYAELNLYRKSQWDEFAEDMMTLSSSAGTVSKASCLLQLSPYIDSDGVLRMKGRIDKSEQASPDTKRPIILPRDHSITRLIILHYHCMFLHHNHETVINELRQKYVVSRLRQTYKSIRSACQYCKNKRAKPVAPEMGELPLSRLAAMIRPFSHTGTDCFGPLEVKVGRRVEKRWCMMFTCLTVRAIHIEVINSLTTDSCILALRCFIARRGCPTEIVSDNGTNYRGANNELLRCLETIDQKQIQEYFAQIKWTFIPPHSPHMGGAWERMNRIIKSNLYEVLNTPTRRTTDETLRCVLAEVEMIINSRPLTEVPIDPHEKEALTPNHFILGDSGGMRVMNACQSSDNLSKSWKQSQYLAEQFWRRWLREYLPLLTRRSKWHQKTSPIKAGDIVIVVDDRHPRNYWQKGVIIDVNEDKTGQVRSAVVKTANGVYTRPTVKLAVLDVIDGNTNLTDCQIIGGQDVE